VRQSATYEPAASTGGGSFTSCLGWASLHRWCTRSSAPRRTPGPRRIHPLRRHDGEAGGGPLRILSWQAPTLLNPHLAVGGKDHIAARIFYEPLVPFRPDATLTPVLADTVPTVENGGLARDGTWVVWRVKPHVLWHDGRPLTADDLVFNWEYATDVAVGSPSAGLYQEVERVERLSDHAVKVVFRAPTPVWFYALNGPGLIPQHVFGAYRSSRAREAAANFRPVGTGPYRLLEFKPGDILRAEANPQYHVAGRPFFDTLELKAVAIPSRPRAPCCKPVSTTLRTTWRWTRRC
jgi:peptide/nickel transport system substrate-binding protein